MNLLAGLNHETLETSPLKWDHAPPRWEPLPEDGVRVFAPPGVDYFQDPSGANTRDNAPFLWTGVRGDFTAIARVRPAFASKWDAGAIMVRGGHALWAKLCYESTDFGTTAVVSVVTDGDSDDANGADLASPAVWLQVCRAGDMIGMHYGLERGVLRMVRVFRLPLPQEVKVGLVTQSPAGRGVAVELSSFEIKHRAPKDLRAGV